MENDYRDLASGLFATATALLEDAIEAAVAGQSPRATPSKLAAEARTLQASAQDIATLAEAAEIIANLGVNQHSKQSKHSD